jgi:ABC-type molybdate transport system ATPase subunit
MYGNRGGKVIVGQGKDFSGYPSRLELRTAMKVDSSLKRWDCDRSHVTWGLDHFLGNLWTSNSGGGKKLVGIGKALVGSNGNLVIDTNIVVRSNKMINGAFGRAVV